MMMIEQEKQEIIQAFVHHLQSKDYPCIAAHDVASKQALSCFVADHMACPKDDRDILNFIYSFVDKYRTSTKGYHSVAILFKEPSNLSEEEFDTLLWMRLQSLSDLDAQQYKYDARVASDVTSPHFSFSLKEEAFYIIGAEMDLIVGLTSCSAEMTNNYAFKPIGFQIVADISTV